MNKALLFKSFSKLGRDFFNLAKCWPSVTLSLKKKNQSSTGSLCLDSDGEVRIFVAVRTWLRHGFKEEDQNYIQIKVGLSVGWVGAMTRGLYYVGPHKNRSSNVFVISFCGMCAYMEEMVSKSRGVEPSRNKSYMVQETNYTRRPS